MFDAETEKDEIRPRFGPGKSQTMPLEWCEWMMNKWREEKPQEFGKYLQRAALEVTR